MITINGRTPEEIKKGLKCCARLKFPNAYCDGCPYRVRAAENMWECKPPEIITDALAFNQQLEAAQPKWISVEDRLPEPCVDVLCCANDMGMEVMTGKWVREQYYDGYYKIYWMPLPEPPKEEA